MAEGARLESVYTARYPGFESLSLRHTFLIAPSNFNYLSTKLLGVGLDTMDTKKNRPTRERFLISTLAKELGIDGIQVLRKSKRR